MRAIEHRRNLNDAGVRVIRKNVLERNRIVTNRSRVSRIEQTRSNTRPTRGVGGSESRVDVNVLDRKSGSRVLSDITEQTSRSGSRCVIGEGTARDLNVLYAITIVGSVPDRVTYERSNARNFISVATRRSPLCRTVADKDVFEINAIAAAVTHNVSYEDRCCSVGRNDRRIKNLDVLEGVLCPAVLPVNEQTLVARACHVAVFHGQVLEVDVRLVGEQSRRVGSLCRTNVLDGVSIAVKGTSYVCCRKELRKRFALGVNIRAKLYGFAVELVSSRRDCIPVVDAVDDKLGGIFIIRQACRQFCADFRMDGENSRGNHRHQHHQHQNKGNHFLKPCFHCGCSFHKGLHV